MPVRRLPANPNLDHLKYQAKDLLKDHAARDIAAAQRIREFHPRFTHSTNAEIFAAQLKLSDAQLTIARESGFPSWTRLKLHIEKPSKADQLNLPHHERIEDPVFRRAADLIDSGDAAALRAHLNLHPKLVHQHVNFEGSNYFASPTLLQFVAENPVCHGKLPANIVEIVKVILDAQPALSELSETLGLVATGAVPRECHVQIPLINLLVDHGADPNSALRAAVGHGENEAVYALINRGARIDLPTAAALGRINDFRRLLPSSSPQDRHLALAFSSQFGHTEIARLLLDAGEDPNRYNPAGSHSHSTPLHQAALAGHLDVVRLLVERGAQLNIKDVLWKGTPADWARHEGRTEVENYLRAQEAARKGQE
jgi:Ankyrin repeats (3 copies)